MINQAAKNIKIDLSTLWTKPINKFVLRHNDLSEEKKEEFLISLKSAATQSTIRYANPEKTIKIKEVLKEINPIIFSEKEDNNNWRNSKRYNNNRTKNIASYNFNRLCSYIYRIIFLKKELNNEMLRKLVYLTSNSWDKATQFIIENHLDENNPIEEEQERINRINDIGLSDIEEASRSAIRNGANNLPDIINEQYIEYETITAEDRIRINEHQEIIERRTRINAGRHQIHFNNIGFNRAATIITDEQREQALSPNFAIQALNPIDTPEPPEINNLRRAMNPWVQHYLSQLGEDGLEEIRDGILPPTEI